MQQVKPNEIEQRSFAIIRDEFQQQTGKNVDAFSEQEFRVIQRVIHATGDFSFAKALVFHRDAIASGIAALKAGKNILTDVEMVKSGVSKTILKKWGGQVVCKIGEASVAASAQHKGKTRSEVAIREGLAENIGIIAIGNAPTALLQIINHLQLHPDETPGLVIGVPVGFVNAAESKSLLAECAFPFITALGRKGGSPVAAAIVNAILRMA